MKKQLFLRSVVLVAIFLAACGDEVTQINMLKTVILKMPLRLIIW